MTYLNQRNQLFAGEINCVSIVEIFLDNIDKSSFTNAYLEIYREESLKRAKEIDIKIKEGKAGKLAGMVISVKDLIAQKNQPVTAASKILEGYTSPFSSTVLNRLLEEDAIVIGRVNCDEFGMGSSNENSSKGPVLNYLNQDYVPGGSSGGSAVSIQANTCHISLGTDTGGSVRQPASFCGIYGLKPTYSALSRYGLLAYASSFDTIGLMGSSPKDLQKVFDLTKGNDPKDSTSYNGKFDQSPLPNQLKIGYYRECLENDVLSETTKKGFDELKDKLKKEGHKVEALDFPYFEYLLPTYYILTTAEAGSNLSRYDGIRYGFRNTENNNLTSTYKKTRSEGFGKEVKRRIFLGTFVLSASYIDAYYTKAQKARRIIRNHTKRDLERYDVIIGPTTPGAAFKLNEKTADPLSMYMADIYTVHASVGGFPAISMPWLSDPDNQMPIGLQAMSGDFNENKLFNFAEYLQYLSK